MTHTPTPWTTHGERQVEQKKRFARAEKAIEAMRLAKARIAELEKALADLVECSEHIPVIASFGNGSVLGIRRAGKYLAAMDSARAALAKVQP